MSATMGALGAIRSAIAVVYASHAAYDTPTGGPYAPTTVDVTMFQDSQIPERRDHKYFGRLCHQRLAGRDLKRRRMVV